MLLASLVALFDRFDALVLATALGVILLVLAAGVWLGHRANSLDPHGGMLELDTWAARNALKHSGETLIGGLEHGYARATSRQMGRCGHLIVAEATYLLRSSDGARFCSPLCAEAAARPFAGGDAA